MISLRFQAALALIVLLTSLYVRRHSDRGMARGLCGDEDSALAWVYWPVPHWALGGGVTARVVGNAGDTLFNCFREGNYVRTLQAQLGTNVSAAVLDLSAGAPHPGIYPSCERAGVVNVRDGLYFALWWSTPAMPC
jgi:hypothetical protein